MKRGFPPKPTTLKLVEGNPSGRKLPPFEVRPPVEIPIPPDYIDAEAKKEWDRITPILEKHGLMTELDTHALGIYCLAIARVIVAERKLKEQRDSSGSDAMVVKGYRGYPMKNPYLRIAQEAAEEAHRYLQQFGMSPSSRTRAIPELDWKHEKKVNKYFA